MRKLIFFLFCFPLFLSAQELHLLKATMQTVNMGAAPGSVTTYYILLEKKSKFRWEIDSVCSIQTGLPVKYNLVKVDDPDAVSPQYTQVKKFVKADRGKYLITFGINKNRGNGRPGAPPQNMKADTTMIEGGVNVYYRSKGKKKQLRIDQFEQLETISAP